MNLFWKSNARVIFKTTQKYISLGWKCIWWKISLYYSLGWLKMNGGFYFNEQITRITNNLTKSIISILSGETAGKNADNIWFPMLKSCLECNLTQVWLSIKRIKLKCCQDNKGIYYYCMIYGTISMKTTQSISAPIKSCEDPDQHQMGTWTLKYTRRKWTTDKIIAPFFDIIDSVQIDHFPNIFSIWIISYKEDKNYS